MSAFLSKCYIYSNLRHFVCISIVRIPMWALTGQFPIVFILFINDRFKNKQITLRMKIGTFVQ